MIGKLLLWYARSGWGRALRRSAFRKFCRARRGETHIAKTTAGVTMETILGDAVDNAIFVQGVFEPTTTNLFRRLAPHVHGLVDVGCNIGYFTCLFGRLRPGLPILAVDANPRMIARTRRNLDLNGILKTSLLSKGLAAEAGTMTLHVPRDRHSLASFAYRPGSEKAATIDAIDVEVTTLSQALRETTLPSGLFVKIDTEGFEYAVLSGLDIDDVKRVDALLIEANHRNLARAGLDLNQLLSFRWLADFCWFEVDDLRGRFEAVTPEAVKSCPEINTNLLFLRASLAEKLGV
jgi:FkbM family methyltransferase